MMSNPENEEKEQIKDAKKHAEIAPCDDVRSMDKVRQKNMEIVSKLLETTKKRVGSGAVGGVKDIVTVAQIIISKQDQYENRVEPNISGWITNINNYNVFYWALSTLMLMARLFFGFIYYIFDTDGILIAYREVSGAKLTRKGNDQRRLLHLVWHCSAYVPILAITIVAWIVLKTGWEAIFFLCLASSAVSLEICLSVILDKVHNLQDLSRQTTRAMRQYGASNKDLCIKWIEYFRLRLQHERTGVAKAALVTIFSVVLFSVVLGIEVLAIWKHHQVEEVLTINSTVTKNMVIGEKLGSKRTVVEGEASGFQPTLDIREDSQETINDLRFKVLVRENAIKLLYDENALWPIAAFCATLLFLISVFKLWIQTRHVLENTDPIDRYNTPLAALDAFLEVDRRQDSTDYLSEDQATEISWD